VGWRTDGPTGKTERALKEFLARNRNWQDLSSG
jgi:hypothetical protein